jgi:hypothetical protein
VVQNSNAWDIKFHFLHQIVFQKIKNIVMKRANATLTHYFRTYGLACDFIFLGGKGGKGGGWGFTNFSFNFQETFSTHTLGHFWVLFYFFD